LARKLSRGSRLPLLKEGSQLGVGSEMLLNERLAVPNDQNNGVDSARYRLLHCVLNEWLAGNRKHFFWNGLARGEHSRAEACRRDHCLHDFLVVGHGKAAVRKREKESAGGGESGFDQVAELRTFASD